jgi:hypothetical protein
MAWVKVFGIQSFSDLGITDKGLWTCNNNRYGAGEYGSNALNAHSKGICLEFLPDSRNLIKDFRDISQSS